MATHYYQIWCLEKQHFRQFYTTDKNIQLVYMHNRLTAKGVLKWFLKEGDLQLTEINLE